MINRFCAYCAAQKGYVSSATLRFTTTLINVALRNGLEAPSSVYLDSEFGYITIGFRESFCSLVIDNWLLTCAKVNEVVFDELNLLDASIIYDVEKKIPSLLQRDQHGAVQINQAQK